MSASTRTRASNGRSSIYVDDSGTWHAWVTVGTKPDGSMDRRHRRGRTRKEVTAKVRELERAREDGNVTRTGRGPTVRAYLADWLEGTRASVRVKTWVGYEVDIRVHTVPAIGGKQLAHVRAEDVERVYSVMTAAGKSAATVAHVRRTLSKAFGDAYKRGYIPRNPVPLAAAPKVEDVEVDPLTVDEARRVLDAAEGMRNGAAFVIALSLGLRRGEVLGLGLEDVDLDAGTLRVRRQLQRHPYRHGCGGGCGKSAKSCPDRFGGGLHLVPVKSAAGRRLMSLPGPLTVQLRAHRKQQLAERLAAGSRWQDHGLVFAQPDGAPVDPDAHGRDWRALLAGAGVRPARLHDARHTAATTLLVQGVDRRVVMDLLGWSTSAMANRYQHVVPELHQLAAERVSAALWGPTATGTATGRG